MVQIKEKTKELINKLPDKKPHLDFLAALLTIPVLVTVILINLGNLGKKPADTTPSPTPTVTPVNASTKQGPTVIIIQATGAPTPTGTIMPTDKPSATPTPTTTPTPTLTLTPSPTATGSGTIQ